MKKLLLLSILLTGCQCSSKSKFVVNNFEYYHENQCTYYISRFNVPINNYLEIIDTCGKYQVGDTLILIKQ